MADRPRHPNKEIEAAISFAEASGWRWRKMGHWGRLFRAFAGREGCQFGVNGTPRNPENHARQIRRAVNRCRHRAEDDHERI
jgi:hypothetical protein